MPCPSVPCPCQVSKLNLADQVPAQLQETWRLHRGPRPICQGIPDGRCCHLIYRIRCGHMWMVRDGPCTMAPWCSHNDKQQNGMSPSAQPVPEPYVCSNVRTWLAAPLPSGCTGRRTAAAEPEQPGGNGQLPWISDDAACVVMSLF